MERLNVVFLLIVTLAITACILGFYQQQSLKSIQIQNNESQPHIPTTRCTSLSTMAKKCSSENLDLLIVVYSAVENFIQRRVIRETWGSWKYIDGPIALFFILGRSTNVTHNLIVQEEQETFGDLLSSDLPDTYENSIYKSLAMLKLVSEDCPKVAYILKADDDVFINVPNLIKELNRFSSRRNIICGYLFSNSFSPHQKFPSKWFVPESLYPYEFYPDFVSGRAYVMSGDVPAKLHAANRDTNQLFLEDVYVTGILAKNAKVERRHCEGFSHSNRNSSPCAYRGVISGYYLTPTEILYIWSELPTTKCSIDLSSSPMQRNRFALPKTTERLMRVQ